MNTRDRLYPDFQIGRRLNTFRSPPCQPPCGKDVLERYFDVLYAKRCANDAAASVAGELVKLWNEGDSWEQ